MLAPRSAAAATPPRQHSPLARLLLPLVALGLMSAGCEPAHRRPSWRILPLPRIQPNDGLAVVSQPDGYGLHIWLDTDTSREGVCRPRWNPDAARLFNGNGSAPFSSGLATREEFYAAVARAPVRQALRRQIEALCRQRAPRSDVLWSEPPRSAAAFRPPPLVSLEEQHLLSDPEAIKRAERQLLGLPPDAALPGAEEGSPAGRPATGSASPDSATAGRATADSATAGSRPGREPRPSAPAGPGAARPSTP